MENNEDHVTCTWNSYLVVKGDRLLIPAAGMNSTEFRVEGTAKFLSSGEDFEEMKSKFPFLNRVLEVTAFSSKQLL